MANLETELSFEEKIEKQFDELSIDNPDTPKYIEHLYSDYVELIALLTKEETTISDIYDKLSDTHDSVIVDQELPEEQGAIEVASTVSQMNDNAEQNLLAIFSICKERSNIYDQSEYPFRAENRKIQLKDDLTDKQKIYLILLISSCLKYFGVMAPVLTKDFELISLYGLQQFLPAKSIVKSFGKNSQYGGNAKNRITSLAQDLNLQIKQHEVDCISGHNAQERGLDLIGWLPYKDNIPNKLIFLCQCACGKNWDSKQGETKLFKCYFDFYKKEPVHVMFISYSITNNNNIFYQSDRVDPDTLMFDRKRIIEQMEDTTFLNTLQSYLFLQKCLELRIEV
jgi:hypothetical protein